MRHSGAPHFASQEGYLLIELLVALTLFSVIILIAVGSFVNALKTQRQITALAGAENNLDTVLEQMAREIRTGSSFNINPNNSSNYGTYQFLAFTGAQGNRIKYYLQGATLEKRDSNINDGQPLDITGGNVNVQYFNVVLFGNDTGDQWNPRVTITLGIQPKETSLKEDVLNLETTVSARHLDCNLRNLKQPKC